MTAALLPAGGPTTLPAVLQSEGITHTVAALIDSGAEGDFMDIELAREWGIPVSPLAEPISAKTLCGTPLTKITGHGIHIGQSHRGDSIPPDPLSLRSSSFGALLAY